MSVELFHIVDYILLSIGLLLNCLGCLCLLKQDKREANSQKVILLNLSIVEISTSTYLLVTVIIRHSPILYTHIGHNKPALRGLCVFYHVVTLELYGAMLCITLDRLACALWPIRHRMLMNHSKCTKLALLTWLVSFLAAIPFLVVDFTIQLKGVLYSSYVMQAVYMAFTLSTYVYIGKLMVRRQKRFSVAASVRRPEQPLLGRMKCKVPFLISLTFVLFIVVPNSIPSKGNVTVDLVKRTVSLLVPIIDPVIYLFCQPSIRQSALNLLTCTRTRTRAQSSTSGMEMVRHVCHFQSTSNAVRVVTSNQMP